jgi:hypothetical protein
VAFEELSASSAGVGADEDIDGIRECLLDRFEDVDIILNTGSSRASSMTWGRL